MSFISLRRINKIYPNGVRAIRDASLEIDEGEFVVFVGPSGCGKSTMLRMIAGLEEITTGELYINGKLANEMPPKDRDIAMVFQNYALYPQMTVYQNMAFGLKGRDLAKEEIRSRVLEAASILDISDYLSRKPGQLSGGQKQRVALGRVLVRRPKLFLLDEPLSNVDAQIRTQMRSEILRLHQKLGITFLYVTHDQVEAMTMANKIVVMKNGTIQQVGTPLDIYQNPKNLFVATFLGTPQMNIFSAHLQAKDKSLSLELEGAKSIALPPYKLNEIDDPSHLNGEIAVGIRPDNVDIVDKDGDIEGYVHHVENLGSQRAVSLTIPFSKTPFVAFTSALVPPKNQDGMVQIKFNLKTLHFFALPQGDSILGVPERTYLSKASLNSKGELVFDQQVLPVSYFDRLVNPNMLQGQTLALSFLSEALSAKSLPDSLALKGVVRHIQDLVSKKGVYLELEDGQNLACYAPVDSTFKEGDNLTLYVPYSALDIYDKPFGNKLNAKFPFFSNDVHLEKKMGRAALLNYRLPLKEDGTPLPEGHYVWKRNFIRFANKHQRIGSLKALVIDDETLGDKAIVYAKLHNGTYLSFVVPAPFDRHEEPYLYLRPLPEDFLPAYEGQ